MYKGIDSFTRNHIVEQTREVTKSEATFEQPLSRLKEAHDLQQKKPTILLLF